MTIENLSLLCAPFALAARPHELPVSAANDASWRARMLAAAHARSTVRHDSGAFAHELATALALAS